MDFPISGVAPQGNEPETAGRVRATRKSQPCSGPVSAKIALPGSKSITNRALLIAALARGTSSVSQPLLSEDTIAFARGLTALGFDLSLDQKHRRWTVIGSSGIVPKAEACVWVQNAGTAARFLLALCAAGAGRYHFDGTEQLRSRPLGPLVRALASQGAVFEPPQATRLPLVLTASGLRGGTIVLDGGESSQFLSALLMAAPLARSRLRIAPSRLISRPFVDLTCGVMKEFGVRLERKSYALFEVDAPQTYRAVEYEIEADASTASYFFAAAALTEGRVTITNLSRRACKQGDIRFLDVLEEMGCLVREEEEGISVTGPKVLSGLSVDMGDISDTFPTLACIAPFANGTVRITNIGHTRVQECDRVAAVQEGLQRLGVRVEAGENHLQIHPGQPMGGRINSHDDHRIAMAFSVLGLRVPGLVIERAQCVSKTCPQFFELWRVIERSCTDETGSNKASMT